VLNRPSILLSNRIQLFLSRVIYWYSKSVCLSVRRFVCPSVRYVPVPDENGLTYRHSFLQQKDTVSHVPVLYRNGLTYYQSHFFSAYGSPVFPVLFNVFAKFRRALPLYGASNRDRIYKFRDFLSNLPRTGRNQRYLCLWMHKCFLCAKKNYHRHMKFMLAEVAASAAQRDGRQQGFHKTLSSSEKQSP